MNILTAAAEQRRSEITEALDGMAAEGHRATHMTEEGREMRRLREELGALGGHWRGPDTGSGPAGPAGAPGREERSHREW